jgi:hypothetical protein
MRDYAHPQVGDRVVVYGVSCVVFRVRPWAVDVEATDGSGRCWRVSGCPLRVKEAS